MIDRIAGIFGLMVIGAVAVTIVTNKNSATVIERTLNGFANDIKAVTGGASKSS